MSDDLRAQIAQKIGEYLATHFAGRQAPMREALCDAILPLVEQEIQQEREKLGVQLNDQMREVAVLQRRALAEKDAQIAALRQKAAELSSALVAEVTARSNAELRYALERFEDAAGVRRETPAPPEP